MATVHDSAGCANQLNLQINDAAQMTVQIEALVNIPCNNSAPGAVYIAPLGGPAAYTYSWSNGQTTQNQTSLNLGAYTVTITDVHSCSATSSINITYDASPVTTVSMVAHRLRLVVALYLTFTSGAMAQLIVPLTMLPRVFTFLQFLTLITAPVLIPLLLTGLLHCLPTLILWHRNVIALAMAWLE